MSPIISGGFPDKVIEADPPAAGFGTGNSIERKQGFPFVPFITAGAAPLIDLGIWLRRG